MIYAGIQVICLTSATALVFFFNYMNIDHDCNSKDRMTICIFYSWSLWSLSHCQRQNFFLFLPCQCTAFVCGQQMKPTVSCFIFAVRRIKLCTHMSWVCKDPWSFTNEETCAVCYLKIYGVRRQKGMGTFASIAIQWRLNSPFGEITE